MTTNDGVLRNAVIQQEARFIGRAPAPQQAQPSEAGSAPTPNEQHRHEEAARKAEQEKVLAELTEEARKQGLEQGLQEGFAQGLQQAEERIQRALTEQQNKVDALLQSLAAAQGTLASSVESDMVGIVFDCLCRILGDEIVSRDTVRNQIRNAVEHYASEGIVSIHVAPADHAWLHGDEKMAGLLADRQRSAPIRWVADPAVKAGGCVLECEAGAIDARLDTQLERIKAELTRIHALARKSA